MALPTSGPISASMIRDEFGQSNPVPISSYYRDGGIVLDIPANSNVPTSGTISYSNFYGASNAGPVNFGSLLIQDFQFKTASTAGVIFTTSGGLGYVGSNPPPPADWHFPAPVTNVGSNFWVRATGDLEGSSTSGQLNTWLQLNTNRLWSVTGFGAFVGMGTLTFEVGTNSSGANAVVVGYVTLDAFT